MEFKEFTTCVKELVGEKLDGVELVEMESAKNNGIKVHGLTMSSGNTNLAPCVYLDGFYEKYKYGEMDISDVADMVIDIYEKNIPQKDFDTSLFVDYANACTRIYGRLVSTERNQELLATVPHREILDLSLIYCVEIWESEERGFASIRINNEHMRLWGVTEEELFGQVKTNMQANNRSSLANFADVAREILGIADDSDVSEMATETEEEMELPDVPMYILSNKNRVNGAVELLNQDILKGFADKMGSDIMILPSSIHELLLIPCDECAAPEELAQMVREVNDTQVRSCEILSYHVYKYERSSGSLSIAA